MSPVTNALTHVARWRGPLLLALVAVLAFGAGRAGRDPVPLQAQVRQQVVPESFKSGGARSEIVLREIAATLKQMDARVERIENAVRRLGGQPDDGPHGEARQPWQR